MGCCVLNFFISSSSSNNYNPNFSVQQKISPAYIAGIGAAGGDSGRISGIGETPGERSEGCGSPPTLPNASA